MSSRRNKKRQTRHLKTERGNKGAINWAKLQKRDSRQEPGASIPGGPYGE